MSNKTYKKLLKRMFDSKFTLYDSIEEYKAAKIMGESNSYFNYISSVFKVLLILAIIFISVMSVGCSAKTIEYMPVNIPIACKVEEPKRPVYTGDVVKDNAKILLYAEELKIALHKCK